MIDLATPIKLALREDPILQAVLGLDQNGEYKVYSSLARAEVEAPYVVFDIIPTNLISSAYGDPYVVEPFPVQLKAWGRTAKEAWSVATYVDDAMNNPNATFVFTPYQLVYMVRSTSPVELPDRDTNMTQVVVQYDLILAR